MKLSSEIQEWVRKKKLQEIGELGKIRDAEIKRIIETTPRGGAQISSIADQHIEFNQKSIEVIIQAYLEAYELEEKMGVSHPSNRRRRLDGWDTPGFHERRVFSIDCAQLKNLPFRIYSDSPMIL